jgi:deoxyribodipyrimidine photo-lyase
MKTRSFPPDRTAALSALQAFVPHAGHNYAARRNHDMGAGRHDGVSQLSPYIRHRVVTEEEVLSAVLGRHSPSAAQKFVQEVFWRTYWKGWLELRPAGWRVYQRDLAHAMDQVQTQSGLRARWEAACMGQTGIACFDSWAEELVETGYLHNHARMWFASIWIFTLRLPWELGADFFLRHLLDGDPASNTLSWRWVAGIQTRGKTYLARPDNIAKYTEGRFCPAPSELATVAEPQEAPPPPARGAPPQNMPFDPSLRTGIVLHEEDLSPGWLLDRDIQVAGTSLLGGLSPGTPLQMSAQVTGFRRALVQEAAGRWAARLGPVTPEISTVQALEDWAREIQAEQIVTAYAPVGPVADVLNRVKTVPVIRALRPYDERAWPHATAGFFKFKDKIPGLLGHIKGLSLT